MRWVFFLLGALVAAPIAAGATLWRARRALARARLLSRRARSKRHLLELTRLTGGLAHEVRNPLSTIRLNLELLAEDLQHSDDELARRARNRLLRLQGEVERLNGILGEFLAFAGEQELHAEPVDLRTVIEELIDFFNPQAQRGHVLLRHSLPDSPVNCRADPRLIKQAVLNLMLNATQAMAQGGELLLRLRADAGRAVLEVIDTGPGIPTEIRKRIFDAYYSSRPGGSGLGLPTTRKIIRQHDGEIEVDSQPGKGTRFIVTLPLIQEASA